MHLIYSGTDEVKTMIVFSDQVDERLKRRVILMLSQFRYPERMYSKGSGVNMKVGKPLKTLLY